VGDLCGICLVVHEEELNVLDVADDERLVARGHHVLGLLVGAIADRGHSKIALEASPDTVVDTLGLAPCRGNAHEAITLVTSEGLRALLHDRNMLLCGNHLVGVVCRGWPDLLKQQQLQQLQEQPAIKQLKLP
jgi:hypothetical protein